MLDSTALDPDRTVLIAGYDAQATIVIPAQQARRAAAVTGGLVRPARPGADCPPVPSRGRHRRPPLAARIAAGISWAAVLLVGGVAVICGVVFLGVTP